MKVQIESLRRELQQGASELTSSINRAADEELERLRRENSELRLENDRQKQEISALRQQQQHHGGGDSSALQIMEETLVHYRQTIEDLQQVRKSIEFA